MYRNRQLLNLVRDAPVCMACGVFNAGGNSIAPAHSNQLRDGRGRDHKSHDYRVAALCNSCHYEYDHGKLLDRETRQQLWEEAHRKTIGWMIETGRLTVGSPTDGQ